MVPINISKTAKVLIETTANGIKQIQLSPWSEEQLSQLKIFKIEIYLQGKPFFYEKLRKDLNTYFSGRQVIFSYPIDWHDITPFTQKVLKLAQLIPWGKIETYGRLSTKLAIKSSPRAVGAALGRNPVPIVIPCHRVQKKTGALGGFSSGIGWKKKLLSLENGTAPETHIEFREIKQVNRNFLKSMG